MATNWNVTSTPTPIGETSNGAAPKGAAPSQETATRERAVAPLTRFNNDSGLVEADPDSPWGTGKAPAEEKPVEKPAADPAAPSRQAAWKAQQDKKKEEQAAKSRAKLGEQQPLVKDLLAKGDIAGAAKALGLESHQLRELMTNSLISMPTAGKEETPEQKLEREREEVRKEREDLKTRTERIEWETRADRYVRDKIRPVLQTDKYEFLKKQDPAQVEMFIYKFMNDHYGKTGKELNAEDVAETMDAELEKNWMASFERHKDIKKLSKLFDQGQARPIEGEPAARPAKPAPAEPEAQLGVEEPLNERTPAEDLVDSRYPLRGSSPAPRPAPRRDPNARVPFATLGREERLAQMREEDEAVRNGR